MPERKNIIFGIRAVIEAIKSGKEIDRVLIKKGSQGDLIYELMQLIRKEQVPYQFVPIEKINSISTRNHQGVIAFTSQIGFRNIEEIIPALFEEGKTPLILILDQITDVRNFGAISRTAECAGADAIIVPDRGSAQINSDAVKTSAGALHLIPVCRTDNLVNTVRFLKNSGLQIIAATEKTSLLYHKADYSIPTAILLGSEEKGISPDLLKTADKIVRIPLKGKIESLNVSVVNGILLFEAVKQRTTF
ncbi:MAG: 23S rRNA (guanosine(2251)-2'-O)-methyltransferase RlmB [Bacteroidia bacterium]|nr:23S rRNA (guanosine(2251)-2'-O)-methyltransferase RlmB [Bacteroidia bacterium]